MGNGRRVIVILVMVNWENGRKVLVMVIMVSG